MPGAVSAMAEAAGFGTGKDSVAKLMEAMKKGQVKSPEVLDKFAKILADRARQGGALEKAMKSTAAEQARFNNAFSDSVKVFSQGGFDRSMAEIFKVMANALERAAPLVRALGSAFEYLSSPFNAVISLAGDFGENFGKLATWLGTSSDNLTTFTGLALGALTPVGRFLEVVSLVALALDDLSVYLQGGDSALGEWLNSIDPQKAENIKKMGNELLELVESLKKLGNMAFEGWGKIFGYLGESSDFLDIAVKNITATARAINALTAALTEFKNGNFNLSEDFSLGVSQNLLNNPLTDSGPLGLAKRFYNLATGNGFTSDNVKDSRAWQSQDNRNKPPSLTDPTTPLQNPLSGMEGRNGRPSYAEIANDVNKNPVMTASGPVQLNGDINLHMPNVSGDAGTIEKAVRDAINKVFQVINSNQTEGEQ